MRQRIRSWWIIGAMALTGISAEAACPTAQDLDTTGIWVTYFYVPHRDAPLHVHYYRAGPDRIVTARYRRNGKSAAWLESNRGLYPLRYGFLPHDKPPEIAGRYDYPGDPKTLPNLAEPDVWFGTRKEVYADDGAVINQWRVQMRSGASGTMSIGDCAYASIDVYVLTELPEERPRVFTVTHLNYLTGLGIAFAGKAFDFSLDWTISRPIAISTAPPDGVTPLPLFRPD